MVAAVFYLLGACCYTHQMVTILHQNSSKPLSEIVNETCKILTNMAKDTHNCHYCIQNHTSNDTISHITQTYTNNVQQQSQLFTLRCVLCLFGIYNVVLVALVYGGPIFINVLSVINVALLFACLFIDKIHVIVLIESTLVLLSTIILLQVTHCFLVVSCANAIGECDDFRRKSCFNPMLSFFIAFLSIINRADSIKCIHLYTIS